MAPLDSPVPQPGTQGQRGLLPVSVAFADYDRTRPLVDGRVKPAGIALKTTTQWVGEFCTRPVYEEFDAAEMSLSWYIAARDRGEPCIALPVFPLRDPMWAYMYTRTDSPITDPSQLRGRRVGMQGYRFTIYLWLRGLLKDYYNLPPEEVTWCTSEAELNGYVFPPGIRVEKVEGKSSVEKLRDGEVDAIWAPLVPKPFQDREPWIRRLFPDAQGEFQRFHHKTGLLPFSHCVVMSEKLAKREPWVAKSLYDAFVEAQQVADECCNIEKMISYVDSMYLLEQQKAAWGSNPYEHGMTPANRRVMELFVRYGHEQGYISRRLSMEELFVGELLAA